MPIETGTQHLRRSQKPVPRVEGQLRLIAAGACIPAPAKASLPVVLFPAKLQTAASSMLPFLTQYSPGHRCGSTMNLGALILSES